MKLPVTQSDETPTLVSADSPYPNSKSYMWVHRSGELYKDNPIVIYEYQKGREHHIDYAVLSNGKTAEELNYCINQEKYLKVFLENGDVPIDNSASERSIRTFCIGKKNWMFHNTANGATASARVYSISETAKLNNLRPYNYFKYILTELPNLCDEKRNIDPAKLNYLMPWSKDLPEECRKPRRS